MMVQKEKCHNSCSGIAGVQTSSMPGLLRLSLVLCTPFYIGLVMKTYTKDLRPSTARPEKVSLICAEHELMMAMS